MLIILPPLVFLAAFYFLPLKEILALSFSGQDIPGRFATVLKDDYYRHIIWFTFWQAFVSTVLTLLVALPGAYVFARYEFRGKDFLKALATVPFVLPTVVVAAAFHALLGPRGVFNAGLVSMLGLAGPPIRIDQTIWFILLAHVFYNYSVILRLVGGFWSRLDPALGESARMLGAGSLTVFRRVTWPLLRPAVLAAGLLVFVFCFSSFGVILILGGPRFATMEVEIYRQAVHIFNLPVAAVLSLLQILFTFLLMWVYTGLQHRTTLELSQIPDRSGARQPYTRRDRVVLGLNLAIMLLLLATPLLALLLRSVSGPAGFTLQYYQALFSQGNGSVFYIAPFRAVINSLGYAVTTMIMALLLGIPAATYLARSSGRFSVLLDPLFMLPLSTSAVTLGFGFILAFDEPPLNLRASLILVPLAHTLVAFPFVVRGLLPALRSIPEDLRDSAAMLGAAPLMVWRYVDLPIIMRAVTAAAVFAFTISMGEFGASVFVAQPQAPTMPLAIYRFLGQPGALNYGQAMAMSSILMLVTVAAFIFIDKSGIRRLGEI